jgi:hypothetical protein
MGVVIETCIKYPGGPTRNRGTDMRSALGVELIGIGTSGVVIQSGSDDFGSSSSHFFRSGGGDVGVGFSLISSVNTIYNR